MFDSSEISTTLAQDENWDVIYDGLNQSQPLNISGMDNVLIRNSTFNNIKGSDAIYIRESNNVRIENVTINNTVDNDAIDIRFSDNIHIEDLVVDKVSGKKSLKGVGMWQTTNVTIEDSQFSQIFSSGQSAAISVGGGESANITIDDNHIYNAYGNGIVTNGTSDPNDVHDAPVLGLNVTNNLIHDIGLTPTPVSNSPTHGMYIKAQDAYVANNTVYNSFDGSGISIRSTAVVQGNKIWDTKGDALAFYQQKPAGSSGKSVVENNELFFTENRPKGWDNEPLLRVYWAENSKHPLRYDTFEIRNNKLSIYDRYQEGNPPLVGLYTFDNLTFADNELVDNREQPKFFSYYGDKRSYRIEEKFTNSFNGSEYYQ